LSFLTANKEPHHLPKRLVSESNRGALHRKTLITGVCGAASHGTMSLSAEL
jgi:hypothetical protein